MMNNADKPVVVADIVMLAKHEGGRDHPIRITQETRYWPHVVVDDRENRTVRTDGRAVTEHYMGVRFLPAEELKDTDTGSGRYPLCLIYFPRVDYSTLQPATTFTVREGAKVVGHGEIVSRQD